VSDTSFFVGGPRADGFQGVTFWASYVFFNAIFPKLAHDLPEARRAREEFLNGSIKEEEFERRCSMARSKIMNVSYFWNNVGFTICGALSLAALVGIGANDSTSLNNWGYSVSVAVCTGFWIVLAIPWFLWEKRRPGPTLPAGDNYLTFGFRHTWWTAKKAWTLKQTFFYLVAFFLLADGIVSMNESRQFSAPSSHTTPPGPIKAISAQLPDHDSSEVENADCPTF
jgi:hypothetical protein